MKKTVLYISSILPFLWGITHLFFTTGVVNSFGSISADNRIIITMEWIVEGVTLIFIGIIITIVTITETESPLAKRIYLAIASMLFSLAIVSLFTGFRVDFLPYKMCPFIFSLSAILIIAGMNSRSGNRKMKNTIG